jgi:hypothetical protein
VKLHENTKTGAQILPVPCGHQPVLIQFGWLTLKERLMQSVLFRTGTLLAIVFGFSTNLLAAPPAKLPVPVINAVVTDVPGQIEIVGSGLSINLVTPTVKASFVDSSNALQTVQLGVLASGATSVAAALPANLRAGNYLVSVQTTGGTSNGYDFTIAAPAAPATIPASSITVHTSAPASIDPSSPSLAPVTLEAVCDSGSVPTGGGINRSGDLTDANISILESKPHATAGVYDGWEVILQNAAQMQNSTGPVAITAYVTCLSVQ